MKIAGFIILKLILSGIFMLPQPVRAGPPPVRWDFENPDQLSGWKGEGMENSSIRDGNLWIRAEDNLQLISPSGLQIPLRGKPHLVVRYRSHQPRFLRVFLLSGANQPVVMPTELPVFRDQRFHTVWVPLTGKEEYRSTTIEQVGIFFGGRRGWVEIDSIEIRPFSLIPYFRFQLEEFFYPKPFLLGTINSLRSRYLFNTSFVGWLNYAAVLALFIGVVTYLKSSGKKKIKIVNRIGITLLAIWILYDCQETFSQFQIVKMIHQSYLKPPPEEKKFPPLGDYYGFLELVKETVPPGGQYNFYSYPDWPFDARAKYFLYPRRAQSRTLHQVLKNEPIPYHVVYRHPGISYEPGSRRLVYLDRGEKKFLSPPGEILAQFKKEGFIFREGVR